ncbi:HprK-related kinase A [Rhodoferax sp. U2-2l]|uniref:HprK-related kinase A n=1 Tax=Rhodoferax sp. U2-2l TaxID=2884000 RepID=UPI001D0B1806|nr:HprK-related kinase A [Rhodoferax sp. U2-2l]MCB8747404.1 HprK-related kinase A [Rhodoferax sp. U2-2l]
MIDTVLHISPFNVRVRSTLTGVAEHLDFFYQSHARCGSDAFVDFDLQILHGKGLRRWWHPQVRLLLDDTESFFPLPADQAAPMLEWGLNWCIASRPLGYLVMHAGLLARGERALMMPGVPGAGKSTLSASLCLLEDWRLLSDELAILDPASGLMQPHARPICLKNASIDIASGFPQTRLGRVYHDTRKGTISHAACPPASIAASGDPARVEWVVFPRFEFGSTPSCEEISRVEAFSLISEQSFNRERMGEVGFDALCQMLNNVRCYQIVYGSTADGLQLIRDITHL